MLKKLLSISICGGLLRQDEYPTEKKQKKKKYLSNEIKKQEKKGREIVHQFDENIFLFGHVQMLLHQHCPFLQQTLTLTSVKKRKRKVDGKICAHSRRNQSYQMKSNSMRKTLFESYSYLKTCCCVILIFRKTTEYDSSFSKNR